VVQTDSTSRRTFIVHAHRVARHTTGGRRRCGPREVETPGRRSGPPAPAVRPHALSRGGNPDQHNRRRHPPRLTRFHDRDRGGCHRQFLGSWSKPSPVRRLDKPDPSTGPRPLPIHPSALSVRRSRPTGGRNYRTNALYRSTAVRILAIVSRRRRSASAASPRRSAVSTARWSCNPWCARSETSSTRRT